MGKIKVIKEDTEKVKRTSNAFRFRYGVGGVCFSVRTERAIFDTVLPSCSTFLTVFLKGFISFSNVDLDG